MLKLNFLCALIKVQVALLHVSLHVGFKLLASETLADHLRVLYPSEDLLLYYSYMESEFLLHAASVSAQCEQLTCNC